MRARSVFAFTVLALAACKSTPSKGDLEKLRLETEKRVDSQPGRDIFLLRAQHTGPAVARGDSGSARFAAPLYSAFDAARALALTEFADGFYREPANDGYEQVLDRLESELRGAGFGTHEGLTLAMLRTPREDPAWTPLSARLALHTAAGETVLAEFRAPGDAARTLLPRNAPSAHVTGPLALAAADVRAGDVLVLDTAPNSAVLADAHERGAVLVLAAGLASYNVDPTGAERHLDAIPYGSVRAPSPLPVARISPRMYATLAQARRESATARVAFDAEVRCDERELRTLVATVTGSALSSEAVVVAAHVQEPGACDNASGLAGACEIALGIARAIREGELERPARTLVFLWGEEHAQSRLFLENTELDVIAGISADMLGESSTVTGALALLERLPDPGAVKTVPPDVHTAWGGRAVSADELPAGGLATIARCALLDVAALDGAWKTSEHPFEGGSDHDEFLKRGIPGVLFWHFPDFAYHTSLDRLAHVDGAELRRMASVVGACALAVADAQPRDLERYLASLRLEVDLRCAAARAAEDEELVTAWRTWGTGARQWLRKLCLPLRVSPTILGTIPGVEAPAPEPPAQPENPPTPPH